MTGVPSFVCHCGECIILGMWVPSLPSLAAVIPSLSSLSPPCPCPCPFHCHHPCHCHCPWPWHHHCHCHHLHLPGCINLVGVSPAHIFPGCHLLPCQAFRHPIPVPVTVIPLVVTVVVLGVMWALPIAVRGAGVALLSPPHVSLLSSGV
jgi:hypothetical protein